MYVDVQHRYRSTGIAVGLLILVLVCLARPACANPIVVSEIYFWPASAPLLLLIIPLESFFAVRFLEMSFLQSVKVVSAANIVSTLAGFPLAWGFTALLESLDFLGFGPADTWRYQVAGRVSFGDAILPTGQITAIFFLFFVLNYLVSVWIESRLFCRLMNGAVSRVEAGHWAQVANAASYLFVYALILWSAYMRYK